MAIRGWGLGGRIGPWGRGWMVGWNPTLRLLATALALLPLSGPVQAQSAHVVNQLSQSADLVYDIQYVCPAIGTNRTVGGFAPAAVDRLPEDFGSATVYQRSANIIWTARIAEENAAFLFFTGKGNPERECITLIVLDAGSGKVRVAPSVPDGNFRKHLPLIVSTEVDKLLAECKSNPLKARRDFLLGEFLIADDGTVAQLADSFNCDSAVMTTVSAIDITAMGKTIRVVYVYDEMFLFEILK